MDTAERDQGAGLPVKRCVSVVTVSFFTGPILYHVIDALLKQPALKELIVVENGNRPRTSEALQRLAAEDERVILLSGHGNIGFGAGCNLGAARATGEYLLLLNPDALVKPDSLAAMLAEGERLDRSDQQPWLLGVNLVDPDGHPQRGARRGDLTPLSAFFEVFQIFSRFSPQFGNMRINRDPAPAEQTSEIEVISGACMFMRLSSYLAIHGMDEDYFLHVEDIDFCLRFRKHGGSVFFAPAIRMPHFQGASQEITSNFIEWQKAKSFITYFHKHFSRGWRLPFVLGLDLAILGRFGMLVARNFLLAR